MVALCGGDCKGAMGMHGDNGNARGQWGNKGKPPCSKMFGDSMEHGGLPPWLILVEDAAGAVDSAVVVVVDLRDCDAPC